MVVNYAQKFDNKVDERFTKEALSNWYQLTKISTSLELTLLKCILFLHLK